MRYFVTSPHEKDQMLVSFLCDGAKSFARREEDIVYVLFEGA
jgi:hypothetical protein